VIASGRHSPALLAELEKREHRLEEISDELLATDGRGIDAWPPPNEPHKISLQ
jgi:hypothetical protein